MTVELQEKVKALINNRWLVFVCAMWVQSCTGFGYLFGSISPVIKTAMGYNQRQISLLGVVKDLGGSIGFVAGSLCDVLPMWGIMFIGVVQNAVGYGFLWLVVTQKLPSMPLWVLCICIFVGNNSETYFNTGDLVSCVQNFPETRGPVVGILKGFSGLSGAILSQIYTMINASDQASLILMIAVGPSIVVAALMFVIRPVGGHEQVRPSDSSSFLFTFGLCLVLTAYMLIVVLLEDLFSPSQALITLLTVLLIIIILTPVIIPVVLVISSKQSLLDEESSLLDSQKNESGGDETILGDVEDETCLEDDSLPASESQKQIGELQAKLMKEATGDMMMEVKKGPSRREDFTLMQALTNLDFWLIFSSMVIASGSGLTIIDNMGQICESLGYNDASVFVSMISIWNFLGRIAGGYLSEVIIRNYAFPRPVAMAMFQVIMAVGFFYYAMAWPRAIYVVSVLIGLAYGAHWAIVPAAVSELFGLKNFGPLYNFLTSSSAIGTLVFSGVIASSIYDHNAEKQSAFQQNSLGSILRTPPVGGNTSLSCAGFICYSITCAIMSGLCLVAVGLSLIVAYRTKGIYARLYGNSPI